MDIWAFLTKLTVQLQENILGELTSRKLHIAYSFVIQRITWIIVWELVSSKISFQLREIMFFGINFAISSVWSVSNL